MGEKVPTNRNEGTTRRACEVDVDVCCAMAMAMGVKGRNRRRGASCGEKEDFQASVQSINAVVEELAKRAGLPRSSPVEE